MIIGKKLSEKILDFRNKHYKNQDVSLLDVITDYSWENEIPMIDIAEELKEDELFKEIFEKDLIKHNYIKEDKTETKSLW